MSLIGKIKQIIAMPAEPLELGVERVGGLLTGAAIGEALGLPVVGKSREDLQRSPVTELLGFGDYSTPAGTYSMCTESLVGFARYLIDNYQDGYTVERFFRLCNSWYIYKAKDEDHRLKIMLPCAALAGVFYSRMERDADMAVSILSDLMADSGVASSALVFYIAMYLAKGYGISDSVRRARNSASSLCKRIGLVIGQHSEQLMVVDTITEALLSHADVQDAMLKVVNSGCHPDLTGNLSGFLLGLFYGMENIPYLWRNSINDFESVGDLSAGLIKIL